jgi:hypothetical protein
LGFGCTRQLPNALHAPGESVDPAEIAAMALAEALGTSTVVSDNGDILSPM